MFHSVPAHQAISEILPPVAASDLRNQPLKEDVRLTLNVLVNMPALMVYALILVPRSNHVVPMLSVWSSIHFHYEQ